MDTGKKLLAGEQTTGEIYSKINLHPMCIKAVVKFDECHNKPRLTGSTTLTLSKIQYHIYFNASNSTLKKKSGRGQIVQREKRIIVKYTDEVCSMFSFA